MNQMLDNRFKRKTVRPHDLSVRLPESKKYIKKELQALARGNGMTLSQVIIIALERFMAEIGSGDISLVLKNNG